MTSNANVGNSGGHDSRLPQIGEVIESHGYRLLVVELLASGTFSEVFKLRNAEHMDRYYAMKLELRDNPRRMLKLDAYVLTAMKECHGFPQVLFCGRTDHYDFIVMQLIGQNLAKLRRAAPEKRFSTPTVIHIAQLTLSRIESLHRGGLISRDIKASNFAISIDRNDPTIYMFDFGLARRYRDANGNVLPPRRVGALLGTVLYAPLATHETMEQCRHDDLESWFYMCVEMFKGHLPWEELTLSDFNHHTIVADMKRFCRGPGRANFLLNCPPQFDTIFDIIISIGYYQEPNYALIREQLDKVTCEFDIRRPYDWNLPGSLILERAELIGNVGETRFVSERLRVRRAQTIHVAQSVTCRDKVAGDLKDCDADGVSDLAGEATAIEWSPTTSLTAISDEHLFTPLVGADFNGGANFAEM